MALEKGHLWLAAGKKKAGRQRHSDALEPSSTTTMIASRHEHEFSGQKHCTTDSRQEPFASGPTAPSYSPYAERTNFQNT